MAIPSADVDGITCGEADAPIEMPYIFNDDAGSWVRAQQVRKGKKKKKKKRRKSRMIAFHRLSDPPP